jgi:protein-tyrosine phosphatase
VIDLHSHILPGLDDGVRSLAEARELGRAARAVGITAIAATPHVRDDFPTTPDQMEAGVGDVRRELAEHGVGIEVLHGGEIALDRLEALGADDLARFSLGQSGRYVLIEFPYFGWPLALEVGLRRLRGDGFTGVLGHPERNPEVQESPARLERAVATGALVQITARSLAGSFGRGSRRAARRLLDLGLVHLLASDAHGAGSPLLSVEQAAKATGDRGLARYLTIEAPAAVAAGEPVPLPTPRAGRRRG